MSKTFSKWHTNIVSIPRIYERNKSKLPGSFEYLQLNIFYKTFSNFNRTSNRIRAIYSRTHINKNTSDCRYKTLNIFIHTQKAKLHNTRVKENFRMTKSIPFIQKVLFQDPQPFCSPFLPIAPKHTMSRGVDVKKTSAFYFQNIYRFLKR